MNSNARVFEPIYYCVRTSYTFKWTDDSLKKHVWFIYWFLKAKPAQNLYNLNDDLPYIKPLPSCYNLYYLAVCQSWSFVLYYHLLLYTITSCLLSALVPILPYLKKPHFFHMQAGVSSLNVSSVAGSPDYCLLWPCVLLNNSTPTQSYYVDINEWCLTQAVCRTI